MPRKKTAKKTKKQERISVFHRRMTIGFLIVSIILILLIVYFALSQVKIFITPQTTQLQATFNVSLLTNIETTLAGTNILPGSVSTETQTVEEVIAIESGTPVPDNARGEVTIYNNYSRSQPLIRTTRLLTPDGKLYRLDEGVTVPAGGQVTASVYSDQQGVEYNIAPTTFTIPGLWEGLQDQIYAESFEPFTGGERLEKQVTEEMLSSAADQVVKQVSQKLKAAQDPDEQYVQINQVGDALWQTNVSAGDSVDQFTITAEIPITTIRFKKEDLEAIAINNLVSQMPADQQFISGNLNSMKFELTAIDQNEQSADFTVTIQGKSASRIEASDLDIEVLKGKTRSQLIDHLTSLPAIAEVNVVFIPTWLQKVPPLEDHVYIHIVK